ncbi:peroxidasin-like [Clytia hemisphaerica]|uniref:Ig-like domain-containing protein n=1 Tax=Clytia hemisphaerica TaxID=252671 RepID=A0A7M5VDS5_9CNID|eukprot:TCONS_00021784-protein
MEKMEILFCLLLFIIGALAQQNTCPRGCTCIPGTVRCINVRLERVPKGIPENTYVLDLRYNKIKELKREDFKNLKNLENLFLGNNLISSIESDTFADLKKLRHLYLFSNRLRLIDGKTFTGLSSLEQLYLQNNAISKVGRKSFGHLSSLQRLYLHRNRINSITRDTLAPLRALRRLRLSSNRIQCTCAYLRLIKELTFEHDVSVGATCRFQENRQQTSTLKFSDLGCYKPRYLQKPERTIGVEGRTVDIDCQAEGNPTPVITWFKDGASIPSNVKHTVHNGTLTIENFSQDAVGFYQCNIENVIGKSSSGAPIVLVSANVVPSLTEKPSNIDAVVQSIALFSCRASGSPRPSLTWLRQGQVISPTRRFKLSHTGDLEIREIRLSDAGLYTCRASNGLGSVSNTARLTVRAPPRFTLTPFNQAGLAGTNIGLSCRATGYPTPVVTWQKNGARLPSDGRHVILPSGQLRISRARKEDEGQYECSAFNVIGVVSTTANLTIKAIVPPKIVSQPSDTTVQSGNTIAFRCRATGDPKPIISWKRNDVQITDGRRFRINPNDGSIEIKDIGKIDEGRWECNARNSLGDEKATFSLNVIGSKNRVFKGDKFVLESLEKARSEVDRAIQQTKEKLASFKPKSPADLLALFRFPSPDALEIARSAEIFEVAIDLIQKNVDTGLMLKEMNQKYKFNELVSPEHIRLLANLSGCTAHKRLVNCSDLCFHHKYRTYDGQCNNFNHPMWGSALTPFTRLLIPNYENGFNTPFGWSKVKLPSARKVSSALISSVKVTADEEYTHMLMQWGQFLDHDMDFTVTSPSSLRFNDGKSCKESCENEQPCFPIEIPKDDPRIKKYKCMEFTRSSAVCGSGSTSVFFDSITPRQQINQITSFIDASNVYGSSEKDARDLRATDTRTERGLLKRGIHHKNSQYFLPFNQDTKIECQINPLESQRTPCFLAGDHRANEQLGLLSMHTIWMRQHNHLARQLQRINPHWNGEKIYQETRKIVGAQMQHITFNEWLPKILGTEGMEKLGKYEGYNQNVEPTIFNSFATGAFRFGHTLIQPIMARLNSSFQETPEGSLPLHKAFFSPYRLVEEGGTDPLIRGLFGTPVKSRGATHQPFNTELTERLFEMAHTVALDLAALNIQRGRDHGLPTYNKWRQFCNLPVASSFNELKEIKNETLRQHLADIYGDINHVDLFVGGILEDPIPGSRLGPTFMCLISLQFKRLRDGDRFWYENPSQFTSDQLIQIKETTLSRVICDNSDDIRRVQLDAFRRVERTSDYTPCNAHRKLDLRFWKECCGNDQSCSARNNDQSSNTISNFIGQRGRRSRRSVDIATTSQHNMTSQHDHVNRNGNGETSKMEERSMKKRMRYLERNMKKVYKIISNMQNEMDLLKKQFNFNEQENETNPRIEPRRQCIDNGLVREHGEKWFDERNYKCRCKHSKVLCS